MDTYAYDYSTDYTDLSGVLDFVPVDELADMAEVHRLAVQDEVYSTLYSTGMLRTRRKTA